MNLIKEMEGKLLDQIINEAKSPQDEAIKASITEWKLLQKKLAVVNKIAKAVTSRITELETGFEEVIKGIDGNKTVVDGAIIEYTQKKGNTTVKYKEAVDYALKMVNEAQKKVLEDFVKSVTKSGEIKNVLAVVDPDLEKFLIDLSSIDGTDMMDKIEDAARAGFDRLPKQVANAKKRVVKEGVGENIAKVVKNLVSKFKTVFRSVFKSIDKADKAASAFASAVKADPLKEGKTSGEWTTISFKGLNTSKEDRDFVLNKVFGKNNSWGINKGGDRTTLTADQPVVVAYRHAQGEPDLSVLKKYKVTVVEGLAPVVEFKDHMGDTEFKSFASWKSACRKADPQYWLDGDKDIAQAMVGAKPFAKGKTRAIGEWDGEVGTVFGDAHLNEAVGINKGIRSIVASIKAIDMESDSDSLDSAGLRLILKELSEKWNEPGVPGSDESSEAKNVLKVSKMLEDLIKFLPKPESTD